jgi:hypothetical protein
MQILEAALAFAITMLVLSLTCSSFVEIIHRIGSMREAGLKYMLGRIFDQVLTKYLTPSITAAVQADAAVAAAARNDRVRELMKSARDGFVERMSANRAPMGVTPKATPTDPASEVANNPKQVFGLWSGRDLSSMTSAEFMERLGTIDIGAVVKQANADANAAGAAVADAADAVLKDIAQKFDAFGKEAAAYFEGRARLLSVCVAIVLAFAIRVDAIELFNTYLRDPNARNKVIEQTQAVTAQYKAISEAANALEKATPDPDVKKQVEALQKDLKATIDGTRNTVKQYSDLGLPIGWTKENATLNPWAPTCTSKEGVTRVVEKATDCKTPAKPGDPPAKVAGDEVVGTVGCWAVLKLVGSLLLGGILIGLGGPFWYDAVTGLTNIRSIARDVSRGGEQKPSAAQVPQQQAAAAPQRDNPDKPQPSTPVGAFTISQAGKSAAAGQQQGPVG